MNLMNMIMDNPQLVGQLSKQFGLSEQQTKSAAQPLLNNMAGAFKNNLSQENGVQNLLGAIQKGNHGQRMENLSQFEQDDTIQDGNNILGHLFGNKETSRQVASNASQQSGVDSGVLKKMLPVLASMVMGGVSKQESSGGMLSGLLGGGNSSSSSSSGGLGALASFFDSNNDGSVVDDIAKKFLKNIF